MKPVFLWANAARTLACGLVILVHINFLTRSGLETWWPGGFLSAPFFACTVPVFFVLAGFFNTSAQSYTSRLRFRTFFRKLCRRLIVPFLCWNCVLLAVGVEGKKTPAGMVIELLTGVWHLYFLFALVQLRVITFFLDRYITSRRQLYWVMFTAFFLSLGSFAVCDFALWQFGGASETLAYHIRKSFTFWAAFYGAGYFIRHSPGAFDWLKRKYWFLLGLAAVACVLYEAELYAEATWIGYNPQAQTILGGFPIQLIGAIFFLLTLQRLERFEPSLKVMKIIGRISPYTYSVYLSHPAVLFVVFIWFQRSPWYTTHWVTVPLLWIVITCICLGSTWLIRHLRLPQLTQVAIGSS